MYKPSKFTVGEEIDPPQWVEQAAEGADNVRPFMLGWNEAVDAMEISYSEDESDD